MPKSDIIAALFINKLKNDAVDLDEFKKYAKKKHIRADYLDMLYAFTIGFEAAEEFYHRGEGDSQ